MGVYRQTGNVEGVAEHDIGGLAPHPRQFHQRIKIGRDFAAVVGTQNCRGGLNIGCLGAEEPGGLDEAFKIRAIGTREVRGGRVGPEECRGDLIDPHIGALGREHRRHKELEGRRKIELAVGIGVGLL